MPASLTLDQLQKAMSGTAAAFRCVAEYEPAGGPGDKIFPPTYEGGKYATEVRRIDGELVPCVLLDSVQSQANRMELALLGAWEENRIPLPVIIIDFAKAELPKPLRITSLEAPHRIADALLRDSLLDGKAFRKSAHGQKLDNVSVQHATTLFELCPTALLFGLWDSTGPRGGLGAKFARALVSEIVGLHAQAGKRTSSRLDPAQIQLQAGPLYRAKAGDITWTLDEKEAARDKKGVIKLGKDGKPSEANHSNVTPSITDGGVTISKAVQTTVLSFPALRRLRFPLDESPSKPEVDLAARVTLAALGLCASALNQEQGCDLRSRCQLHPIKPFTWQLLDQPGASPTEYLLTPKQAVDLYNQAVARATGVGLPWQDKAITLTPSPQLGDLVRKSQELAASRGEGEDAGE
jgi:CRISPR-associated protein Csb1